MTDEYVTPEEHNSGDRVACLEEMRDANQRCLLPRDHDGPHMCPADGDDYVLVETLAQIAHDAFDHVCQPEGAEPGEYTNDWQNVDPSLKAAWEAAAKAVVEALPGRRE